MARKPKEIKVPKALVIVAQEIYAQGLSISGCYPLPELVERVKDVTGDTSYSKRQLKEDLTANWVGRELVKIENGCLKVLHDGLQFIENLIDRETTPGALA